MTSFIDIFLFTNAQFIDYKNSYKLHAPYIECFFFSMIYKCTIHGLSSQKAGAPFVIDLTFPFVDKPLSTVASHCALIWPRYEWTACVD